MIELEMVFALGFFTAGLLALACLPAVWARAMRLTMRRVTQLVPLSMDEIAAERDGLRAGFAVTQRRLEQKLEALESRRSEAMVEVGRRDIAVARLEDDAALAATRILTLTAERDEVTRELHEVRAETGTAAVALYDLTGLADRQRGDLQDAEDKARALQSVIDEHRATIASLETRILGLDSRMADLDRTLDNSRAELARTVQAVGRATGERDAIQATAAALTSERDGLAADAVRLKALADDNQHRAAAESQAAAAQKVTIDEMRIRRTTLDAQLAMQAEAASAALARLKAAEAENTSLSGRIAAPAVSPDNELDILRETLRSVADDVLRMTERGAEPRQDPALPAPAPVPAVALSLPN